MSCPRPGQEGQSAVPKGVQPEGEKSCCMSALCFASRKRAVCSPADGWVSGWAEEVGWGACVVQLVQLLAGLMVEVHSAGII